MANPKQMIRVAAMASHAVAVGVVAYLFSQTSGMTLFCVIAGVLIGCGGAGSVPGRPISAYSAFGSLMGYAFWVSVSAINQGAFTGLIPATLLAIGVVWFLQQPARPSVIFTIIVTSLLLIMAVSEHRNPYDVDGWEPDEVRRSALTAMGALSLGLMYLGIGFAECRLAPTRKPKQRKRPRVSIPSAPLD
jgi:hypothetical protein